jgi:hypothetical protein
MGPKPKRDFGLQTEWMRAYAQAYLPNESGFWFSTEMLKAENVTLIDIRHALRVGHVINDEKLDRQGARWTVISADCDGKLTIIQISVVTEEVLVSLLSVKKVEETIEQKEKRGENDVA